MLKTLLIFLAIFLVIRLIQSYLRPSSKSRGYNSYRQTNYSQRKEGETQVEDLGNIKNKKIPKNELH